MTGSFQRRSFFAGEVRFGDPDVRCGDLASSSVELRPVRPFSKVTSQLIRRKKSLISLQLTIPARPPGTGWGVLESVMPLVAAKKLAKVVFAG